MKLVPTIMILILWGIGKAVAQSPSEMLLGTWTFDQASSFAEMDSKISAQMTTNPEMAQQITSLFVGRKLIFEANGSYRHILSNGSVTNAGWSLEGDVLLLTDVSGTVHRQRLGTISDNQLVIVPILAGDVDPILPKYIFLKD